MTTRDDLVVAVESAQADLAEAKKALADYDDKPPFGTLVLIDGPVWPLYAIRLRDVHNKCAHLNQGPGWQTIHSDGSGQFFPDATHPLSKSQYGIYTITEVYRP